MNRNFRGKERTAVWLAADGKSDLSGESLGADFHVDHVVPVAAGGETDVANAQALLPRENLMKSSRHVELRGWQRQFFAKWFSSLSAGQKDFLLSALPGAGKTIASLYAASRFLKEHPAGRIVVVVPSVNLREQWQDEAWELFELSLQSKEFAAHLKGDDQGAVVTYQTAASSPLVFRSILSKQPTMVIFDEIHHAGDEKAWGAAIQQAFEMATCRLCLSGTPFRSDGTPIPFIRYGPDGNCTADSRYDYPEAVREGLVRVVSFHSHAGKVEYRQNGQSITAEINESMPEEAAQKHLRKLLTPDGQWVREMVTRANDRLMELRRFKPDAGGLILCIESIHATSIADVVYEVTGQRPDIVLSDSENANSSVKEYRESNRTWIVAVRQVSEGVDIKRLMVLCYFTTTTTRLFFRQAVGRIVRNEGTEFDEEAYCYLPDDPRLIREAREIMQWQGIALKQQEDEDDQDRKGGDRDGLPEISDISTSDPEFRGIIIEGQTHQPDDAELIREVSQQAGISESKAAVAIKVALAKHAGTAPPADQEPPEHRTTRVRSKPPEQEKDSIRSKIKSRVNRLARHLNVDHKEVHQWYIRNVLAKGQANMTLVELKDKLAWVERRIHQQSLGK